MKTQKTIKAIDGQIILNRALFPLSMGKIEIIYTAFEGFEDGELIDKIIIKMDDADIEKLKNLVKEKGLRNVAQFNFILNKISVKQEILLSEVVAFLGGLGELTGFSRVVLLYENDVEELRKSVEIMKAKRRLSSPIPAKNTNLSGNSCDYCKRDREVDG